MDLGQEGAFIFKFSHRMDWDYYHWTFPLHGKQSGLDSGPRLTWYRVERSTMCLELCNLRCNYTTVSLASYSTLWRIILPFPGTYICNLFYDGDEKPQRCLNAEMLAEPPYTCVKVFAPLIQQIHWTTRGQLLRELGWPQAPQALRDWASLPSEWNSTVLRYMVFIHKPLNESRQFL